MQLSPTFWHITFFYSTKVAHAVRVQCSSEGVTKLNRAESISEGYYVAEGSSKLSRVLYTVSSGG
jgi:hypothetical protein